jgi:hypothetical protein
MECENRPTVGPQGKRALSSQLLLDRRFNATADSRRAWWQVTTGSSWVVSGSLCSSFLVQERTHHDGSGSTRESSMDIFRKKCTSAPVGTDHLSCGGQRVLRLRHALYGLRQAFRAWSKRLESGLTLKGIVQSDANPAL